MTAPRIPGATYRLQLHEGFTLREAAARVEYLSRLGVTDLYLSPVFAAVPGSAHGYDICDHARINPELGGEEAFAALHAALREKGMGLLLDFVPNHMAAHPSANAWWRDVLENGPASPYAGFFDVAWDPAKPELRGKVLLPILGDQYGRALERGELRVAERDGGFALLYFEHDLPVNPRSAARILDLGAEALKAALPPEDPSLREYLSVRAALAHLPGPEETDGSRVEEGRREAATCRDRLRRLAAASPDARQALDEALARLNGQAGDPASFDALHALLEEQPYRLAYWRTSLDEINYRRFFDINGLAGLRQENEEVFRRSHEGLARLAREGKVTGVRLDHIDGLHDPAGYLARLQGLLAPDAPDDRGFYVVAEKILSLGEDLPAGWPLHGTTGYDFLNDVNGLFVDGRNALPLKRFHARFTGRTETFPQVAYEGKYRIMVESMTSELGVLAHELNRLSERGRATRDFTLESLRRALREVVAAWPLYRTYVSARGWTEADERAVDLALARVRQRHPAMEPSILDFIRGHLLPPPEALSAGDGRLAFAMRFQQYTAPVHAKGVEDTAFYRHSLLISLNEVGGEPHRFGRSVNEFHEANARRRERHPHGLLSTATHDTKRGEDGRLRIDALAELLGEWRGKCMEWARVNAPHRSQVAGAFAPDRNEEYFLYQTLVGAWPADAADGAVPAGLKDRLLVYAVKALREAKTHTSWIHNNAPYEEAVKRFIERSLEGPRAGRFLASFSPFARRVAFRGALHALAQTALKMTAPGVPDVYQGAELWDLSLADPDNRRPVDFGLRERLLAELASLLDSARPAGEREAGLADLLAAWPDGRVKLFLTAALLAERRRAPDLFRDGDYQALAVEGPAPDDFVAFARARGEARLLLAVPRRGNGRAQDVPRPAWRWGHRLAVPKGWEGVRWRNALTGRGAAGPSLDLDAAAPGFPVAVFAAENAS